MVLLKKVKSVKNVINYNKHNKIQEKTNYLKNIQGRNKTRWEMEKEAPGMTEGIYKFCEKVYKAEKKRII